MGALLTAPIGCLASCGASMLCSCCTAGCCKLATIGTTDTTKGARCVLFWLQVVAVFLGWLMAMKPMSWLDKICDKGLENVGICECHNALDQSTCYSNNVYYRTESSVVLVYLFLLILTVSGCAKQAAASCPIGKFLVLLIFIVVQMFIPNDVLNVFAQFSGVASSAYLVAQTILLVDFGYGWNDAWFLNAQVRAREMNPSGERKWQIAIVSAAAGMSVLAIAECSVWAAYYTAGGPRGLIFFAFVTCFVLLILSCTDWCEDGNLLTSAVVWAYIMWLCYEALVMLPLSEGGKYKFLPEWLGLAVAVLSLIAFVHSASFGARGKNAVAPGTEGLAAAERGAATADPGEDGDATPDGLDVSDFSMQCFVQAMCAVYVTATVAPSKSNLTYGFRIAAVVLSLCLYAWSLVARKVLKNRNFD